MSCRKDVVIIGLQLWLPLNGDVKNYGLCNAELSYSNLAFEDSGKIGKCLSTGGIVMSADTTGKILNNNAITISLWLYVNAPTGSDGERIFGNNEMGYNNNRKFSLYQYPTCNDFHYSWMNDTPDVLDAGLLTNVLPSYQWTHIAVTYDNPNICVYINGELKHTSSGVSNSVSFHYTTNVIYDSPYHKVNDFRLYDECLSPKQVKYISQAMICHYPMGNVDGKIGGRNLILNGKGNKRAGFFKYFDTVTDQYGEVTLKSKWSYTGIDLVPGFVLGCRDYEVGAYYIWSYDIMYTAWNFPSGSSRGEFWIGQRYAGAPSGEDATGKWQFVTAHDLPVVGENGCKLNEWYHVKRRVLIPSQASSNVGTHGQIMFYNPSKNVEASFTARFRNVKLEKGTESTPWTPAPEDNSQFYDNIIPDISGYRNNATVKDSTSPTWSDDSPRYLGSYRFDATKEMFLNPIVFSGFADSYTFSWWGKNSQPDSSMYWGFIDGNRLNLYNTDGYLFWNIGDSQDNPFNDPVTTNKVSSYIDGKWHHYCVTGDGESNKLYVDGKIYGIAKTYRKITGTKIHINGWDDGANYKINGNISDFRIYATALSESDVLNLYQSSASLDSQGNLMLAGEVIE
mgnify:CR=1 FL=1